MLLVYEEGRISPSPYVSWIRNSCTLPCHSNEAARPYLAILGRLTDKLSAFVARVNVIEFAISVVSTLMVQLVLLRLTHSLQNTRFLDLYTMGLEPCTWECTDSTKTKPDSLPLWMILYCSRLDNSVYNGVLLDPVV